MSQLPSQSGSTPRQSGNLRTVPGGELLTKLPPQAREIEQAVLGAVLIDKDALTIVISMLGEETFYDERHSYIFKAIHTLYEKSSPVDMLTVAEELKILGTFETIGGFSYLMKLTNTVASGANTETHALIIREKYFKRQLIKLSKEISEDAYNDSIDVFELLDSSERKLFDINNENLSNEIQQLPDVLRDIHEELSNLSQSDNSLTGIPSGFTDLDRITSGWQRSDLIIVAARPSMGKTSFCLALALNAALNHNHSVAIFSLEMPAAQVGRRLLSMKAKLNGEKLRKGNLSDSDWSSINSAISQLNNANLHIDDTSALSLFEMRAKCRRIKRNHGLDLIVIDYLQLMTNDTGDKRNSNREQEISGISRGLKALGKELNVPVIALAQLNRSVETRGGKKIPLLSDLRESGAIEQDADIVSFIYRPEYYEIMEYDDGESTKDVAEIIIRKHRNGSTGTVKLKFEKDYANFAERDNVFYDPSAITQGIDGDSFTIESSMNGGAKDPFSDADFGTSDDDIPF